MWMAREVRHDRRVTVLMDSPLNQVLTAADADELVKMGSIRALNRGKYSSRPTILDTRSTSSSRAISR